MKLLDEGLCSIVCDSKLKPASKLLAPKAFVEICKFHDMGNLLKNALDRNLKLYDDRAEGKLKVNSQFRQNLIDPAKNLKHILENEEVH